MNEARRARSVLRLWLLTVVLAALAVALGTLAGTPPAGAGAFSLPWWALCLAFLVVHSCPLYFQFRGETHSFSLDEIALVIGLFTVAPWGIVLANLLACVIVLGLQRIPFLKLCFNLAQLALGTIAAIVVFDVVAASTDPVAIRNWLAAFAATTSFALVGAITVAAAISLAEGHAQLAELGKTAVLATVGALVNTALGLIAVMITAQSVGAALLLAGPILIVFAAYRAYLSERNKRQRLQFLYQASQVLSGAEDLESGLVSLLDFARNTFHAEIAEVVVAGEEDEGFGFRSFIGPANASATLEAIDGDYVDATLVIATAAGGATLLEPTDELPVVARSDIELASVMVTSWSESGGHARGAVVCARPKGVAVEKFSRDELQLFDTFTKHLGVTLDRSRLSRSLAQLRVAKQELDQQARFDSLTGLANRKQFRDRVDGALASAALERGSVAVLFIDLDDFKSVNDTMGHAAGDALLQELASRIASSVREHDTAARLGGDEFAVLLPTSPNEAVVRSVADRILESLAVPVAIDGQEVTAKASIGIARGDADTSATDLMHHADMAMYTAKRNGKGRFDEFDPSMRLSDAGRAQVRSALTRAIADDQVRLRYLPIVGISSGEIRAVEAFIEWDVQGRGAASAAELEGVAEETGMIVPIGRNALRVACGQAGDWTAMVPELRVFVHVTPRQLNDADVVTDVRAALDDAGLAPEHLVLCISETTLMRELESTRSVLDELHALGVGLAIDDFGAGFSSLGCLRELPVNVLRVADEIARVAGDSTMDAAFLHGIVELGHILGMQVGAAAATDEQFDALAIMGCDLVRSPRHPLGVDAPEIPELLRAATTGSGRRLRAV